MHALGSTFSPIARRIALLALASTLLVVPVTIASSGHARAADGISTQTIASIADIDSDSQLIVMRMVVEPGVTLAEHHHPGPTSFVVISGTLQTTLIRGGASVNRNGMDQVAELGDTMNLSPGVVISYSPDAVKTLANHDSAPLVLMATMLLDHGQPMVAFEDGPALFISNLGASMLA